MSEFELVRVCGAEKVCVLYHSEYQALGEYPQQSVVNGKILRPARKCESLEFDLGKVVSDWVACQ